MLRLLFKSRKARVHFVSFFECLIPKKKNKILIVVKRGTVFSGNLRLILELLVEKNFDSIYIYSETNFHPHIKEELKDQSVKLCAGFTFLNIYHILSSGVIFLSHSPRDAHLSKKCNERLIINLWHGAVFKNIENLMDSLPATKKDQILNNTYLYDMLAASSQHDKLKMCEAFGVSDDKVHVTGMLRYEILKSSYQIKSFHLAQQNDYLRNIKGDKSIILYAPTFREKNISPLLQLDITDWEQLSNYAYLNNAIICVRPHYYDKSIISELDNFDNIFFLSHENFTEANLVLKHTDILVVDFSSIWIDFLLLNRPIVRFAKDYSHYIDNERGLAYDLNMSEESLQHATTIPGLLTLLDEHIKNGNTNALHPKLTKIFHEYDLSSDYKAIFWKKFNIIYDKKDC